MAIAPMFETCMLVCFGCSWPVNVVKSYKARTARGMSLAFILLIITGYLAGITAKLVTGQINYVLGVYLLNLAIVMVNLFVYIRNKTIDRQTVAAANSQIGALTTAEIKAGTMNYSYSLHDCINYAAPARELKNSVILLGGTLDCQIPVQELGKAFNFNCDIYNKSRANLTICQAKELFADNVAALEPEALVLHLGDEDLASFSKDSAAFDNAYLSLIAEIKKANSRCRLALVSIANPDNEALITSMNNHIKAIAASEKATFINLDNSKLWSPESTKAAMDFACNMGLNIRKPLCDVAEVLYGYVFNH